MKKFLSICLVICVLEALTGCSTIQATDLMIDIQKNEIISPVILEEQNVAVTDFAVRLFQQSMKAGENTLISPLSILAALSMTANGADGETLSQMESVLGMPAEELNAYMYAYMQGLPKANAGKLALANSIWFTDDEKFTVNRGFLQTNADYYGAGIYETPFNNTTRKDINLWVKENTDGMVKDLLDEIPEEAIMYLVNSLAFEAEWQKVYEEVQVREAIFTKDNGDKQKTELMYASENVYLKDEHAKGFMKYYEGNQYAFVALLPEEGISVDAYVHSLTGEKIRALLENAESTSVDTAIPKFETEYEVEMSDILKGMGMPLAFDPDFADFTRLGTHGDGNIYINRVLHKTFLSVAEKGTKAGAATAVEMVTESAMEMKEEPKEVILDRPFVYMLVDFDQQIPFFIGTVMRVE